MGGGTQAMSTAAWMNERIAKENRLFPPDKCERPKDSPPRKTAKDACESLPPHGHKAEEEWLMKRRAEVWQNNSFAKTAASNKLSDIHSIKVKNTPTLKDPKRSDEEIAALMKEREEKKKAEMGSEFKVFGRPKSEEVAFMERMQSFADITRG